MNLLVLFLCLTFIKDYQHFITSKKSDELLYQFGRDTTNLAILKNDPVKIWFIRNHFPNEAIESLLVVTKAFPRQPSMSAVLRWEAHQARDPQIKLKKIALAKKLDPFAIDNLLYTLLIGIELKDQRLLQNTIAEIPFLLSDFQIQVLLLTNALLLLYFTILGLGFVFVFSQLFKYFPLLVHRLGFFSHKFKDLTGILVLLSPLIIFFNVYILFIIYSTLLLFVLVYEKRNWLRLTLVLIILSLPLSYPITILSNFLQRQSKTYDLYSYLKITYPEPIIKFDKPEELFIVAYSFKNQKLIEESRALYENILQQQPRSYESLNNLANINCLFKRFATSESLYLKAISLAPARGEAHFNLGWCYLKELKFYEASRSIDKAKSLNFTPAIEGTFDIPPQETFFWRSLLMEKATFSPLLGWQLVLPIILLLILTFVIKPFPEPTFCFLCSRAVCKECCQLVGEDIYCNECWSRLSKTKSDKSEQSILDHVQIKRKRWENLKSLILTLILPGLGHYYQGRVIAGSLLGFIPISVYLLFYFNGLIINPPYWTPLSLTKFITVIGLPALIICYIIAFLSIRSRNVA